MKTMIWIIVGVLVSGGLATYFALSGNGIPVDAVKVAESPIREFVDERGKTRLPETYLITMPSAGRVEGITLTVGTKVKKGQVVAQMVPLDLKLAVEESEASVRQLQASIKENAATNVEETALRQAKHFVKSMHDTVAAAATRVLAGKAKLDYAEKRYGRVAPLAKTGVQTQDELDQAILEKVSSSVAYREDELIHMATVAMAAATDLLPTMIEQQIANKGLTVAVLKEQEAAADARLKQVRENQRRGTITSPVDGIVLERIVDDEQFLAAGTSLMEIGRLEDLEVEADILSLDVVAVKPGHRVEIYGPAIGKPQAKGTVEKVYPAGFTKVSSLGVEQQRVKVIIRFDPGELERLLSERHLEVGYRVRVRIITAEKQSALIVPRSALFRGSGSQWQLFAIRDGRACTQDVTVGLMNDREAEVTEGLRQDDMVIVAPETSLADGTKVSPQKESRQ
ncbi:MAG: efflux RND transporter periplasmic adaptor subunit [Pirellulales bacterium]|nr:efflux RND transporter periplasmic adaptor subunit [Pirellulales bacterium]